MQVPYLGMSLTEQLTIAYHKDMQQYHNTVHKTICLSKQKREWKKRKRKNCSLICCIMVFCGLLLFNFNKCVTWVIYLSHSLFLMLMLPWLISPTKRSHKIVTLVSQTVWDSIWNRGLSKKILLFLSQCFCIDWYHKREWRVILPYLRPVPLVIHSFFTRQEWFRFCCWRLKEKPNLKCILKRKWNIQLL